MLIRVHVIPRSGRNTLAWEAGGVLKARLLAPPVDGAANEALISLLSEWLAIPRRSISIVRGATGRQKTVELVGLTVAEVEQRLLNHKS